MDYIFIIGPSAVGKTTLAKELYKHYHGVYFEQNMVPEFEIPEDVADVGVYEEQLCWDNVLLHRHNNEGGLFVLDYVERANAVIMGRKLLPNEVQLDIAEKTKEEVLQAMSFR